MDFTWFCASEINIYKLAANAWLKPARQWLNQANSICKIATSDDLLAKKELCQEIFGSNLILKTKKAQPTAAQTASPPKSIWVLLCKTKEKAAQMGDNFSESIFMVRLVEKYFNEITNELDQWREILAVPYRHYLHQSE